MQGIDSIKQHIAQYADSSLRQQIFTRIDLLGQKLGIAAAHIWGVLVRQAYAQAAMNIVWFIIMLIGMHWIAKWARQLWNSENLEEGAGGFLSALVVVGYGITFIFATSAFIDAVGYLINPEYFAFNSITSWIKNPSH